MRMSMKYLISIWSWLNRKRKFIRIWRCSKKSIAIITSGIVAVLLLFKIVSFVSLFSPDYLARIIECETLNPYEYEFHIQPKNTCDNVKSGDIILCLVSAIDDLEERESVRKKIETWPYPITVLFFLGETDKKIKKHGGLSKLVSMEAELTNDIVQSTFLDSSETLNLKRISIMKWVAEFCPRDNSFVAVTTPKRVKEKDFEFRLRLLKSEMDTAAMHHTHFVVGPLNKNPVENIAESSYCVLYPRLSNIDWSITDDYEVRSFPTATSKILYEASQRILWTVSPKCDVTALSAAMVGIPNLRMYAFWPYVKRDELPPEIYLQNLESL